MGEPEHVIQSNSPHHMFIGDDEETESGSDLESEEDVRPTLLQEDNASSAHESVDPPSPEFLPNPVGLSMLDDPLSPRPVRRVPCSPRVTPLPSSQ